MNMIMLIFWMLFFVGLVAWAMVLRFIKDALDG